MTTRVVGPRPAANAFAWRREVAHLLHVDGRAGDPFAPLEGLHVLAQRRALGGSIARASRYGRDEEGENGEPEEDRRHRQPPAARIAPRERHHDHDLDHHEDDRVPPSSAQGSNSQLGPAAAGEAVALRPTSGRQSRTGGSTAQRTTSDDHPDDHSGADRPQPRARARGAEPAATRTSSAIDRGHEREDERRSARTAGSARRARARTPLK